MKRGDLVTIAIQGDFGKPRPALVVQNNKVDATPKVLVCPLTRNKSPAPSLRLVVAPTPANGLREISAVMVSSVIAVPREKCGAVIGSLTPEQMQEIDTRLAFILGLAF
ncbi:type II toxin-antitoxin system PemK/MazF family toxin [Bosea sp. PAMC 26642]|uniref:type II toxin-antitoxin system PemK/MazF family toxin n=1 Tax=Bosea sp. (strain PAMC 26642) TaxID=1792307 RepID=UPI0007702AE2|nr:type II toxin-antitoxin system PemK/MazF family toxin [Bosea sp. PAMC 26642]AMJ59204.1 growth inhibitor PemK [Bosea sp. PAMC 26642]